MLRLKLFGVPVLEREDEPVTGRAAHRHRLALLALLALAPSTRLSRDKLIALLWPDSGADRGRNLLKVSTYVLRSELGEDVLLSVGDDVCLNTARVAVDALEFEAALAVDDQATAVALYRGPLLDGFFLSGSPDFEQWVDRERDRLAGGYRRALELLAEAAETAGDLARAVDLWKARAAHDPYDSRVALRLMTTLAASGNRAGALQHATVHARLLEAEYAVAPPPEVAAFAERMRRDADRLTAASALPEITQQNPALAAQALSDEPATRAPDRQPEIVPGEAGAVPREDVTAVVAPGERRPRRKRWIAAAAFLLVPSLAGALWAVWPRTTEPQGSIVVLPFVSFSANTEDDYFSDGLTEEIITRLAAVPGLKVISRTSAMHYKRSTRPLPQIARELGVQHVLEGSVRRDGGRVRISAQLIDARGDQHLWAENYETELNDSFRAQEQIASEVARALEVKLSARVRRLLVKQGTSDPAAYDFYQRARYLWNTRTREGHERAIEYYNRATQRDSTFADAYAGLAHVYLTAYQLNLFDTPEAEAYDRLKWASERALALDDESADAHLSFAIALQWQRNWPGAAREFRRAIDLNPGHATARSWYSLLLRGMGRSEEALRQSRLAAELDPFGVVIAHNYGLQCYHARDLDCATEQYSRSLEVAPYPGSFRGLGIVHARAGRFSEGIDALRQAVALAPQRSDFVADLAYVHALAGRSEDARSLLARAKAQPFEAFNIARAHLALGDTDSAFTWLERSNWRWPHRANRDDPALDALRADPRFLQLRQRVDREMGVR